MADAATLVPKLRIGEVLVAGEFISPVDLDRALAEQSTTNERVGEILIRLGIITEMELNAVLHFQSDIELTPEQHGAAVRHKLGDLLLKAKKLTKHQLDAALAEQERTNEKLGQVLLRLGLVTGEELEAVLAWQHEHSYNTAKAIRFMLGEILVASKVITRGQLQSALQDQALTKRQIGDILVEAGHAKPNHIAEALRIQSKLVAASLLAIIGSAALTGCGTGATLSGINVYDGTTKFKDANTGRIVTMQVDVKNGLQVEVPGGATKRTVASGGGGLHSVVETDNGDVFVDDVRWFKQGASVQSDKTLPDNTCAQAASTMVLRYWLGEQAPSYQQVVDESNKFNLATTHTTITNYMKAKGLDVKAYKNGTINHLKSAVDAGHPTIAMLQFDVPHYVVVVGYNEEQGEIWYHDSIDGPYQKLSESAFRSAWYNNDIKNLPLVGGQNYVGLTIEANL